ncbi:Heat shock transcription factor [Tilletia horrida]|nr:Heat shock transcription factor [Tilletia horrida]
MSSSTHQQDAASLPRAERAGSDLVAGPSSSSSSSQLDGSGRSATPMNRNNPAFLNKLRSMLDDKNNEDLIKWAPDGKSFFVPNHIRFGDTLLPKYFKHRNFSSFVRQLNMYGFHKVPHLQQGALDADQAAQSELWEFTNELFTRDEPELTAQVQRKKPVKPTTGAGNAAGTAAGLLTGIPGAETFAGIRPNQLLLTDAPYSAGEGQAAPAYAGTSAFDGTTAQNLHLHPLFPALQAITVAQSNINSEVSRLRSSNDDLWREAIDTRQRLKQQQDSIRQVINFLASIYGGRALANAAEEAKEMSKSPDSDSSSSRADIGGSSTYRSATPSSSRGLNNAKRVAVYRPKTMANGRLMIEGSGNSDAQDASGRIQPIDESREAEIFELPDLSGLQGNGKEGQVLPSTARTPNLTKSPATGSTLPSTNDGVNAFSSAFDSNNLWASDLNAPASSTAMVLPSNNGNEFSNTFSSGANGLPDTSALMSNGALASLLGSANASNQSDTANAAGQLVASNPDLAQHTAGVSQSYEDMQRVNSYLQALIEGIMQGNNGNSTGTGSTGPLTGADPSALNGGIPSFNALLGGVDGGGGVNSSNQAAGPGAAAAAATPGSSANVDLEALLSEFLDPAAAAATPSPRPAVRSPVPIDPSRRISGSASDFPTLLKNNISSAETTESPLFAGEGDEDEDDEDDEDEDDEDDGQGESPVLMANSKPATQTVTASIGSRPESRLQLPQAWPAGVVDDPGGGQHKRKGEGAEGGLDQMIVAEPALKRARHSGS